MKKTVHPSLATLFSLGIALLTSSVASAALIEGIDFPNQTKLNKQELILNGVGLRLATWFEVRVYAAGLYLKNKADKMEGVLKQDGPKYLEMVFLRDVGVDDIRSAWDKSLEANCEGKCEAFRSPISELQKLMLPVKKGDRQSFTFTDDEVVYSYQGKPKGKVAAKGFGTFLLSTWLGKNPPNESLKEGLLGKTR